MRLLFLLTGLLVAAGVCAATPEETVRKAMSSLAPNVRIDAVQESAVPGFYEAIAGGEFVYVANSQWEKYTESGARIPARRLTAPVLLGVPLRP